MAFTTLYLTTLTAPYTPATLRGAWNDTAGAVTRALEPTKVGGGNITTVARAETNAAADYDVLLYRGVSGPLDAQTISGTINVCLGVQQSNAAANMHWHLHVYVTQGDSDTPRGTLLADYTEALGVNEWPTTAQGWALNAAAALSSLAVSAGDRLVVEIGAVVREASATSRTATLWYGTSVSGMVADDLTPTGDETALAGTLTFSGAITEVVLDTRVSHVGREVWTGDAGDARVSRVAREVWTTVTSDSRVSRVAREIWTSLQADAYVTHLAREIWVRIPRPTEYTPELGTDFGPILWVEFDDPAGTTRVFAQVDLPDPITYYHGEKIGIILALDRVTRALSSDDDGSVEGQRWGVTFADTSRYWRGVLGRPDLTRLIINRSLRLRMISEDAWRRREIPRTVALGLVRAYEAD